MINLKDWISFEDGIYVVVGKENKPVFFTDGSRSKDFALITLYKLSSKPDSGEIIQRQFSEEQLERFINK